MRLSQPRPVPDPLAELSDRQVYCLRGYLVDAVPATETGEGTPCFAWYGVHRFAPFWQELRRHLDARGAGAWLTRRPPHVSPVEAAALLDELRGLADVAPFLAATSVAEVAALLPARGGSLASPAYWAYWFRLSVLTGRHFVLFVGWPA